MKKILTIIILTLFSINVSYSKDNPLKIFKKEIITPGVKIGKRNYDQKRSMEAKEVKSDWLVIGRSITRGNIKKNIQNLAKKLR